MYNYLFCIITYHLIGVFHQLIIQHIGYYNNYGNFYIILGPLINLINIT